MNLIYHNTPYTYPANGPVGTVDLSGMPDWQAQQWKDALAAFTPEPPAFEPTYRLAFGTDGFIQWPLNMEYFASTETAKAMAEKYGTGEVVEVPFGGSGGLFAASAEEYHIRLKDGSLVNAGLIAAFYDRNPSGKFPGLADKLIRAALRLV